MNLFDQFRLLTPGWGDLIEIVIVAALFYRVLLLIRRTRAMQILLGVSGLAFVYFVAWFLGFALITRMLEAIFQYGAIAALVVFQPELRSALARLGQSRMFRVFNRLEESVVVDEIVDAVDRLSRAKIGAIIAIEREVGLDEYAQTGSPVDARVSSEMIRTIFTPYSPLHDGAVLVAGDHIRAAGAILPLTQFALPDRTLGTRHRAAVGLSEETDAIVIVVSDETAQISVARGGRLERGLDADQLRHILVDGTRGRTASLPPGS